jgi:hypothetical protein
VALASRQGIAAKEVEASIEQVKAALTRWDELAAEAGVSAIDAKNISGAFALAEKRFRRRR